MTGRVDINARSELLPVALRALLLEDNPGDAELLQDHLNGLRWARFELTTCTLLQDALARVAEQRFALLFVDLSLPDGDGPDVVRQLREAAPSAAVIVLTGRDDDHAELTAVKTGAQEYLAKSRLSADTLSRTVRHALERARLFAQIQSLVLNAADATLVVAKDGTVQFANPAAERLLRRPRQQLVGEAFGLPIGDGEVRIPGPEAPCCVEMRVADIDWMGEGAYLTSLRDITDRKRAADLQARLQHADRLASIGQLAAGVAHEVNNPASFIMANLGFMQEELAQLEPLVSQLRGGVLRSGAVERSGDLLLEELGVEPRLRELKEMVAESLSGIERIVKIVRDLRSFSRIERDEVELVDLNAIVDVACSIAHNEIRHRATLVKDLERLPLVAADRGKLAQVFTNLVVNAAQSIEEGGADRNKIRIRSAVEGDLLVVSVEDTGSGMSEAVRRRVFEPFFTTKPRETGTGLGLSLSAEIVRQHGGDIQVESTPGAGSTFRVRIPQHGPMAERVQRRPTPEAPVARRRRCRVLVIDDEPLLLSAFRRMLGREHEVVLAEGGERALQILASDQAFDVILCDLMMPVVDGVAVHAAIQERAPALTERMVFCSGGAFTPRAKEFTTTVRNICLDKPVPAELLLRVVERVAAARPSS